MKTLVLGASHNPDRYSYQALLRLQKHQHEVVAIGRKATEVEGILIQEGLPELADVDTVTLYLNPTHQAAYYDYIIGLHPRRVIFNPGTENPAFYALLTSHGIHVEVACTLVLLATHQY
ncbi:MAG: CoA-binding protein [Flavobacterium sp.]|jgi:predicted CoA-binding protein|uniref:CoA-binding protein n=1 Tax=Flavobacterium sp. TaxID=239 RepID=UPI0022C22EC5|nr:CoA-binding protein [Flavobacterium sp.]MCZ8169378.1 CoA-binding protein [Flavobacterium sp.]MCZ8296118.1 CoA-binding protein [Flavobacterium sp.]